MGRANKGSTEGRFSALPHHMTESPAWRSLRGSSIKVYIELLRRFNGLNNGDLHLSYGSAAKLLFISKSTVSAAFEELQEKGFIAQTAPGNWYERMAATWRLTHKSDDRPGGGLSTNEWRIWSNSHTSGRALKDHSSVPKSNHMGTASKPDGY